MHTSFAPGRRSLHTQGCYCSPSDDGSSPSAVQACIHDTLALQLSRQADTNAGSPTARCIYLYICAGGERSLGGRLGHCCHGSVPRDAQGSRVECRAAGAVALGQRVLCELVQGRGASRDGLLCVCYYEKSCRQWYCDGARQLALEYRGGVDCGRGFDRRRGALRQGGWGFREVEAEVGGCSMFGWSGFGLDLVCEGEGEGGLGHTAPAGSSNVCGGCTAADTCDTCTEWCMLDCVSAALRCAGPAGRRASSCSAPPSAATSAGGGQQPGRRAACWANAQRH